MSKARLYQFLPAITGALWSLPLHAEEQGGGQLPQFKTEFYPEQWFWLAVSFGILYVLMAFVALPAVRRTQDNRSKTISGDLAAAQAANDAAKSMMTEYEKVLADARAKAQATVSEIAAQAAKVSAAQQAAQQQDLAKRLAEAETKIAAARDAAIRDVKASAADLAGAIVEKVTAVKAGARHA
jgi:F-type H+-transporting ATPase subunit b